MDNNTAGNTMQEPQDPQIFIKAVYKDGSIYKQVFNSPDIPYTGDMQIDQVQQYFIVDEKDRIFHGIDLVNRTFIIGGSIVHTDLPEGEYKLIVFKRVQERSDRARNEQYVFGLQTEIDGKLYKRVLFVHPNGTFTFALRT